MKKDIDFSKAKRGPVIRYNPTSELKRVEGHLNAAMFIAFVELLMIVGFLIQGACA